MNKDLFGNEIHHEEDAAFNELKGYDETTFSERLKRLRYVNNIFPFGQREYGSDESYRIFNECVRSYIFGQYVSTIILSLSFIERRIQEYFHFRLDKKRSEYTLNKLLEEFKDTGFIDEYFIGKINNIRLKRNPFVHHKDVNHENNLRLRSMNASKEEGKLLEEDAKEALTLMLAISKFRAF